MALLQDPPGEKSYGTPMGLLKPAADLLTKIVLLLPYPFSATNLPFY